MIRRLQLFNVQHGQIKKLFAQHLVNLDEDMRKNGIRKHAMILAGWALDPNIHEKDEYRSKLYDASFTHGFRKGVKTMMIELQEGESCLS